jgi:hypothetical protein
MAGSKQVWGAIDPELRPLDCPKSVRRPSGFPTACLPYQLTDLLQSGMLACGSAREGLDAFPSVETTRLHHAVRRRSGVALSGARAESEQMRRIGVLMNLAVGNAVLRRLICL